MSMDRLDDVTIGHACEVEGCSIVCAPNETRCYDHSVMRLIGTLFNETERDVCWGYIGPCDNYAVTTVEHPSDEGQVPLCSHCADRAFFVQPPPHFDSLESLFPGY